MKKEEKAPPCASEAFTPRCDRITADCRKCGWNPKVEQIRKIRLQMGELNRKENGTWYLPLMEGR